MPRLIEIMRDTGADVVMLQEVEFEEEVVLGDKKEFVLPSYLREFTHTQEYDAVLPSQGELEMMGERNLRVLGRRVPVGNALLLRRKRVAVVTHVPQKIGKTGSKHGGNLRNTTLVSAVIRPLAVGDNASSFCFDPIFVASVHLDAMSEEKRVGALLKCLERARKMGARDAILGGDMNSEIGRGSGLSAVLDHRKDGGCNDDKEDFDGATLREVEDECASAARLGEGATPTRVQLRAWCAMRSKAREASMRTRMFLRRAPTGKTRAGFDFAEGDIGEDLMGMWALDHLLYTGSRRLQLTSLWETLEGIGDTLVTGIPSRRFGVPSDHLPIAGEFSCSCSLRPASLPRGDGTAEPSDRLRELIERERASTMEFGIKMEEEKRVLTYAEKEIPANTTGNEVARPSNGMGKNKKSGSGTTARPSEAIVVLKRAQKKLRRELVARNAEIRTVFVAGLNVTEGDELEDMLGGISLWNWAEKGS